MTPIVESPPSPRSTNPSPIDFDTSSVDFTSLGDIVLHPSRAVSPRKEQDEKIVSVSHKAIQIASVTWPSKVVCGLGIGGIIVGAALLINASKNGGTPSSEIALMILLGGVVVTAMGCICYGRSH